MRAKTEVAVIYAIILMIAFALYILLDYLSHERNIYKLLFLIPILMSTILLTNIPSTWTANFFVFYRVSLIIICFAVAFLYFRDLLIRKKKRQQALTQRQREQQAKLRGQSTGQKKKKKGGKK